ncbi:hypothetical protein Tco_1542400, partial [Tanacetum coccineum]
HKEHLEHVVDDDETEKEKKDDKKDDEKANDDEKKDETDRVIHRIFRHQGYMIQRMEKKYVTDREFWKVHGKVDKVLHEIIPQIAEKATNDVIEEFPDQAPQIVVDTVIQERDALQVEFILRQALLPLQHHDDHQEDDAPLKGEKRAKRHKTSKSSKYAKSSLSKQPTNTTPELIDGFQNADKHITTIYNYARMIATLHDVMSNQFKDAEENPNEPPRYLYNKDLFFLKYENTEERSYILSLHKIHDVPFLEDDLEE